MDHEPRAMLSADDMSWAMTRMTHEILERNHGSEGVILLGILTRGAPLAQRLAAIAERENQPLPVGQLDITMYRDDLRKNPTRAVGPTRIPVDLTGRTVVLVDDVLYSGRTIAAAMDALKDLGRPRVVRLAVLIDRGHRELPIQADHVGKDLPTSSAEHVRVTVAEIDGEDLVTLSQTKES